jgi:hypothetical protein
MFCKLMDIIFKLGNLPFQILIVRLGASRSCSRSHTGKFAHKVQIERTIYSEKFDAREYGTRFLNFLASNFCPIVRFFPI